MSFDTMLTAERAERHTSADHWRNRTITDFLDQHADASPKLRQQVDG